jgi:hypothetical protein
MFSSTQTHGSPLKSTASSKVGAWTVGVSCAGGASWFSQLVNIAALAKMAIKMIGAKGDFMSDCIGSLQKCIGSAPRRTLGQKVAKHKM